MINQKIIASAEAENNGDSYATPMTSGGHEFIADEIEEIGGKNKGPAPGDYLCMALASCKAITLRMYVQRKKWIVNTIKVKVNLVKGDKLPSGQNTFFCEITVDGTIDAEQKIRLLQIAKACPISRLLSKPSEVVTILS